MYTRFVEENNRFAEEITKSSVAISPRFSIFYGQETFLTPCPDLLRTSKEGFQKFMLLKISLKMINK